MLCAYLLAGCGIDYIGSTKLIFEGQVTGPNGEPLEGIPVITHVYNNNDSDNIGYDITDSNGRYRMIFPKAIKVKVELWINSGVEDMGLSRTQIYNIDFGQTEDFTIDFGTHQLYEIQNSVRLHLNFDTVSPVKVNLSGLVSNNRLDYNFEVFPLGADWIEMEDYLVAPNQVITLKYMLENGTVYETQIPVGEEDIIYNL